MTARQRHIQILKMPQQRIIDKTTKAVISDVKPAEFEFNIKQAVKAENDTLTVKSESSYVVNHKNVGDNVTLSVAAETADAAKYPLTYKWDQTEKQFQLLTML